MSGLFIIGGYRSQKEPHYPFSDGTGKMLKAMLHSIGINPQHDCTFLNVFPFQAKEKTLFGTRAEGIPNIKPVNRKYVKAMHGKDLLELWDYINSRQPSLILTCGEIALWATTSETSLEQARGYITRGNSSIPNIKILPTYHPSSCVMNYTLRPILLADLKKAKREMTCKEITLTPHYIHLKPTLAEMTDFYNKYIIPCTHLSVDIETKGYAENAHTIACVGLAPSATRALVIPFFSEDTPTGNYWSSVSEELSAWAFIRKCLSCGKLLGGQNYQYDMQYLWKLAAVPNPDVSWDTMLLHHSLQPEMRKSLSFLASLYTNEPAWKSMHKRKDKATKQEDQ